MANKDEMNFKVLMELCLKHSDNLFLILSDDLIIKEINPVALKLFGWKKKDVCNVPIEAVFKKYATKPFIKPNHAIERAKSFTYVLDKSQRLKIHWHLIPTYDNDKKVNFIFIIGKLVADLTDKQVEYLHLANVVKYAPGFFYWKDKKGVYLGCNEEFARLAGLASRAEVIGKTDFDLIWKEGAQHYVDIDKEIIATGRAILNHEEKINVSHNKTITAITNKVPLLDNKNKVIGILGITTDITEQKSAAEALSLARIEADSANALKTNFIQNMQHDIRTPASSLWGVLDNLVVNHQLPDEELLTLLRDSAKQLMDICNDVIDFNRIEQGEMAILSKRFNLHQTLADVVDLNKITAFDKELNLSLTIDEKVPQVVKGDHHRLSRILINLLGNALKFTKKGSVSLSANLIKEVEKRFIIQFKLQDSGIGIPLAKQNTLYEKFNRMNPANRNTYKGFGLGLRIVKKYVDDLGGEINVQSELNKGTTFFIDMPFERALLESVYETAPPPVEKPITAKEKKFDKKSDPITILLIEDNVLARKMGETILRSLNCKLSTAIDVSSALEVLQQIKFDLVVADIGLPDGTGIDVINAVKGLSKSPNTTTPFIALTANADQDTITKCETAGFLLVMEKPMRSDTIKAVLDKFVPEIDDSKKSTSAKSSFTPLKLKLPKIKGQLLGLGRDLPNTEEQLFELEPYPLLDIVKGMEISSLSNEDDFAEVLELMVTVIPQDKKEMHRAYVAGDWDEVEKLAHKAKGGSDYVGALRMKYACMYLERYRKAGHSVSLEKLYHQLVNVLDDTLDCINSRLKKKNW